MSKACPETGSCAHRHLQRKHCASMLVLFEEKQGEEDEEKKRKGKRLRKTAEQGSHGIEPWKPLIWLLPYRNWRTGEGFNPGNGSVQLVSHSSRINQPHFIPFLCLSKCPN